MDMKDLISTMGSTWFWIEKKNQNPKRSQLKRKICYSWEQRANNGFIYIFKKQCLVLDLI